MDPITQSFSGSKKSVMNAFAETLETLDIDLHGRNDRLGLISVNQGDKPLLHAHFVEQSNDTTEISIAPGLPNLKDRNNADRPDTTIQRIMKNLSINEKQNS